VNGRPGRRGDEWEVFARARRGASLIHVGTVRAANRRLAQSYARMTYDEREWAELAVVRRSDMAWGRRLGGAPEGGG
jgi:1,2-phenylacetyl-CoA epoxidase PaaB subunit